MRRIQDGNRGEWKRRRREEERKRVEENCRAILFLVGA